jgi:hypothetical protein
MDAKEDELRAAHAEVEEKEKAVRRCMAQVR